MARLNGYTRGHVGPGVPSLADLGALWLLADSVRRRTNSYRSLLMSSRQRWAPWRASAPTRRSRLPRSTTSSVRCSATRQTRAVRTALTPLARASRGCGHRRGLLVGEAPVDAEAASVRREPARRSRARPSSGRRDVGDDLEGVRPDTLLDIARAQGVQKADVEEHPRGCARSSAERMTAFLTSEGAG